MALHYELKDIADLDAKRVHPADPERLHPILEKLIWSMMNVEIGRITADNAEEFYWRHAFTRRLDRGSDAAFGSGEEVFITLDDVKDYIGLTTNVSTTKDRKKWLGRFAVDGAFGVHGQEGTGREAFDRIVRAKLALASEKAVTA